MKIEKLDRENEQYTFTFTEPEILDMVDLMRSGLMRNREQLADPYGQTEPAIKDYLAATMPDYGILVGAWGQILNQIIPEEGS